MRKHRRVHVNRVDVVDFALQEVRAFRWREFSRGLWSWRTEFLSWDSPCTCVDTGA
jgi:hypothetical protein